MSEEVPITEVPVPGAGDETAGMLLRKAREATGLHVAALAVAMKVPVKKLEALEADRLDELPDAVFARALAASVCRSLKIDPAPILSKLPQTAIRKLDRDARGINTPFRAPGMYYGNSLLAFMSKPAALWVMALLLAALLVVFFPEVHFSSNKVDGETAVKSDAPASIPVQPVKDSATTTESAVGSASPLAAGSAAVAVAQPQSTASSAAVVASAPNVAAPSVADVLVFKARSSAWVRVTDSKGVVQFEKTLAAGESGAASGVPPLSVVVGNVAATEVVVRGQPFNLEALAQNNVARFEVK